MVPEILEYFVAGNKAYIEHILAIARIAFASTEQLTALNLDLDHALLEDGAATCNALLAVENLKGYLDANKILAQPMIEKLVAHWQDVYKISYQTQVDLMSTLAVQNGDLQRRLSVTLEKVAQSGAAGSDAVIANIKAAVAASNAAYRGLNNTTKRGGETTEASLAAIVNAVSAHKAEPKMWKSSAA